MWCGPVLGSVCSSVCRAPTLPSVQPRTHPKSQKRHRGQPESTGTMGQLPCNERTSVLVLTGCQERQQRRHRVAGLPGTSCCREQAALPAPAVLRHRAPCSGVGTAQLWGTLSICTLLLKYLAPKLHLEVIIREGYLHLVLTSYFNRVCP